MKRKLERKSSVRCFLETLNTEPTLKEARSNNFAAHDLKKIDIKAPIDGSTGHLLSLERSTKGYSLLQGLRCRHEQAYTKITESPPKIKLAKKNKINNSIAKCVFQENSDVKPLVIDRNAEKSFGNTSEILFPILPGKVQEQKSKRKTTIKNVYFKDISANLPNADHLFSTYSGTPGLIDQEIVHNGNQSQQRSLFLHKNKKHRMKYEMKPKEEECGIQNQTSLKHLFEPTNHHIQIDNLLDIVLPPPVEFSDKKLEPSFTSNIFTPVANQVANLELENSKCIKSKEQFNVFGSSYSLGLTRASFKEKTANSVLFEFAAEKLETSVTNSIFRPPVSAIDDYQVAIIPEINSNKPFENDESISKKEIPLNTSINENEDETQKRSIVLELQNEEFSSSSSLWMPKFNNKVITSCREIAILKGNDTLDLGSKSDLDILDIQNLTQPEEIIIDNESVALKGMDGLKPDVEKSRDSLETQETYHKLEDIKRGSDSAVSGLIHVCRGRTATLTLTGGDLIHSGTGKELTHTIKSPGLSSINAFPLFYNGFHINPVSGHTLTDGTGIEFMPILFKSNEKDSAILPKGKSPFLKKMQDDLMSPLAVSDHMRLDQIVNEFAYTCYNNDKDHSFFNVPVQSYNDADTALVEEIKFQKNSLKNSRVIGQLDCKFISAFDDESGVIFVVDQHAAHERIKLEELFKEHIQEDGTVMPSLLNQPLILPLSEEKSKIAGRKSDLLQKCGVTFKIATAGLEIVSVPLCFLLRKKHHTRDQLQQLVSDTIDEVIDTSLKSEYLPSTVVSALASMACHGSVRFGRKMSRDSCLQLIRLLSAQKLPFQCAHGRPSVVPLIRIPTITKLLLSKPVKNLVARKKKFDI